MSERAYQEADRIFGILQMEPFADGERKRIVRLGDEVRLIYDGDLIWIQYHVIDDEIVSVLTCAEFGPRRPPFIL